MAIRSPDILTFKQNLESTIDSIKEHKTESHAAIKIQSMLNITAYVHATRFLEASIKHIVMNCGIMKGFNSAQISQLESSLKSFNNPDFSNIKDLFLNELNFDIVQGLQNGNFTSRDISFLNEIVRNRHRNVHASFDSSEWYNQNKKDLSNFIQEYPGMISIVDYLSNLTFSSSGHIAPVVVATSVNSSNLLNTYTAQPESSRVSQNSLYNKFKRWIKKLV